MIVVAGKIVVSSGSIGLVIVDIVVNIVVVRLRRGVGLVVVDVYVLIVVGRGIRRHTRLGRERSWTAADCRGEGDGGRETWAN